MAKNSNGKNNTPTPKKKRVVQPQIGQLLSPLQAEQVWELTKRAQKGDSEALHEMRMLLCEYSPMWVFHHDRLREQAGNDNKQAKFAK